MMTNRYNLSGGAALFVLGLFVSIFILLCMWTDRSLDFWLSFMKGSPVDVPWWLSTILTIVFNGVIVAANLISELIRLAL